MPSVPVHIRVDDSSVSGRVIRIVEHNGDDVIEGELFLIDPSERACDGDFVSPAVTTLALTRVFH